MKRGFLSKKQEYILIGVIGIFLYVILGSFVQGAMLNDAINTANLYQTAIKPSNKDEFNYALDTHSGNILHKGTFEFPILSRFPEMFAEFGAVRRVEEHYNRHTRQVAYSCGKDNKDTCYRTEVYYSWDYEGEQFQIHNKIIFEGREYDTKKIYFDTKFKNINAEIIIENIKGKYFKPKRNIRFYYEVIDISFNNTIFINGKNGNMQGINSEIVGLYNDEPKKMIDDAVATVGSIQFWFWFYWIGTPIVIIIGGFIYLKVNG